MCLNHANQAGKDADGKKTSSSWKKRLDKIRIFAILCSGG